MLRDLGQLQIQLRDYEGYAETRRQVLVAKSGLQVNWLSYAMALYLVRIIDLRAVSNLLCRTRITTEL